MGTSSEDTEAAALRREVRAWLAEHWRPGSDPTPFRVQVVDAGWAAPSWPTRWHGKGVDPDASLVVAEEFARVRAPFGALEIQPGPQTIELGIGGNVVVALGQDSLKARLLRPILLGELRGCLLYSEPGAGSDLASLQTRAERDGDEWVVNGQKVWTTAGASADFGLLIARTDWDQPKHRGISYFILPMRQPGVEVRPIRQMTGDAHFNEVFLTDARAPLDHLVGPRNDGWRVLQVALGYERVAMGTAGRVHDARLVPVGPTLDLVEVARRRGRAADPVVRQSLAHLSTLRTLISWNARRSAAVAERGGFSPAASLGKLAMSAVLHGSASLADALLGPAGTLFGPSTPEPHEANTALMMAFMNSIGGGSDQIQRNIIAERLLGLAKDLQTDRDVPFREVPKGVARSDFGRAPEPGPP